MIVGMFWINGRMLCWGLSVGFGCSKNSIRMMNRVVVSMMRGIGSWKCLVGGVCKLFI